MNTARKIEIQLPDVDHKRKMGSKQPEGYSPKNRPEVLDMMENMNRPETLVDKINDLYSIVDRAEVNLIGILNLIIPDTKLKP